MALLTRHFLIICILTIGLAYPASAEKLQLQEQEIKAALLYNFLKYTDWPTRPAPGSSINLCVFGDDPFQGSLDPMGGRSVNQRDITVRHVRTISDTASCDLLFINADERERWLQLRTSLAGKSVLTVSDFSGFVVSGGMIEFGHKNDHISAAINLEAVAAANLHVQDRLLKLVTVAHNEER